MITDHLIPEFKNIKKIAIYKKLKLHTLNDKKNNIVESINPKKCLIDSISQGNGA